MVTQSQLDDAMLNVGMARNNVLEKGIKDDQAWKEFEIHFKHLADLRELYLNETSQGSDEIAALS